MQKVKINLFIIIIMIVVLVTSVISNVIAFKVFKILHDALDSMLDTDTVGDILKTDKEEKRTKPHANINYDHDKYMAIEVDSEESADYVLCRLKEYIDSYGEATAADLYELVGIVGTFADHKYGWTTIDEFYVSKKIFNGNDIDVRIMVPYAKSLIDDETKKKDSDQKKPSYKVTQSVKVDSRAAAENIIDALSEQAKVVGHITVSDFHEACGLDSTFLDALYGWNTCRGFKISRALDGVHIETPRAYRVETLL